MQSRIFFFLLLFFNPSLQQSVLNFNLRPWSNHQNEQWPSPFVYDKVVRRYEGVMEQLKDETGGLGFAARACMAQPSRGRGLESPLSQVSPARLQAPCPFFAVSATPWGPRLCPAPTSGRTEGLPETTSLPSCYVTWHGGTCSCLGGPQSAVPCLQTSEALAIRRPRASAGNRHLQVGSS